jgi:hypothetical protein
MRSVPLVEPPDYLGSASCRPIALLSVAANWTRALPNGNAMSFSAPSTYDATAGSDCGGRAATQYHGRDS